MITKYSNYIKESKSVDPYFLQTYEETKAWLDSMYINNYTINDDLTVDVNTFVNLNSKELTKIPVQFGKVRDFFTCSNNSITSLKGLPYEVSSLYLDNLDKLTNLKYITNTIWRKLEINLKNLKNFDGLENINIGYKFIIYNIDNFDNINGISTEIFKNSTDETWFSKLDARLADKYFEHWITKDISIVSVLKDKVSNTIKEKYKHLFNANNFDLL